MVKVMSDNKFVIKNGTLYKYQGDEREVIIPSYVLRIAPEAFMDNKTIQKVAAPIRLMRLGNRAFYGCDNLKEVLIPGALFRRMAIKKIFTNPDDIYFRFYASRGLEAEFDESYGAEWDDVSEESVPAPEEPAEEPAEVPAEAPAQVQEELAAEEDDREQVTITASPKSFAEAYIAMDESLRDIFNKIRDYALTKKDAMEAKLGSGVCVKRGSRKIVKLTVRRGYPVALFQLENEMLKDFRRTASTVSKLKIPATELVVRDEEDLETAYAMVDLSADQIQRDIEDARARRREANRARRRQREAEKAAQKIAEAEESPEAGEAEAPAEE